jgi:hypothetical protein
VRKRQYYATLDPGKSAKTSHLQQGLRGGFQVLRIKEQFLENLRMDFVVPQVKC